MAEAGQSKRRTEKLELLPIKPLFDVKIERRRKQRRKNIATETTKVETGNTSAKSSYKALRFDLISPRLLRRLAQRKTVGGEKYGPTNSRIGLGDVDYVIDRLNHFFTHQLDWREELGQNKTDDHFGAMLWAIDYLAEVEHFYPEVLKEALRSLETRGASAKRYNDNWEKRKKKSENRKTVR